MAATKRRARLSKLPTLPKVPGLPNLNPSASLPPIIRGPRGSVVKATPTQPTEIPMAVLTRWPTMTLPEFLTMWALNTMGLKLGSDYGFQEPELGEYIREAGSAIVDFVVYQQPRLCLMVQGLFWHPLFGRKLMADLSVFQRLQTVLGYVVIPLDEDDLMLNALYVVKAAVIEHRDMSRYRGLF